MNESNGISTHVFTSKTEHNSAYIKGETEYDDAYPDT
jgi:hypothetical protein